MHFVRTKKLLPKISLDFWQGLCHEICGALTKWYNNTILQKNLNAQRFSFSTFSQYGKNFLRRQLHCRKNSSFQHFSFYSAENFQTRICAQIWIFWKILHFITICKGWSWNNFMIRKIWIIYKTFYLRYSITAQKFFALEYLLKFEFFQKSFYDNL